jgi:hypothetical protein
MNDMKRQFSSIVVASLISATSAFSADAKYHNDFEKAEAGSLPEDLMVLDGGFTVKAEGGNKFVELPGAPLDAYSFLFGPNVKDDVAVSARIFGTSSGRKYPAFECGAYGVGGYKLRASPAKRMLELYRGDALKTSVPLKWESAKWAHLKLQVTKTGDKQWKIEGKCWQEGTPEPGEPALVFEDSDGPSSGRASVGGMAYSGTPIRFDDLTVSEVAKK